MSPGPRVIELSGSRRISLERVGIGHIAQGGTTVTGRPDSARWLHPPAKWWNDVIGVGNSHRRIIAMNRCAAERSSHSDQTGCPIATRLGETCRNQTPLRVPNEGDPVPLPNP